MIYLCFQDSRNEPEKLWIKVTKSLCTSLGTNHGKRCLWVSQQVVHVIRTAPTQAAHRLPTDLYRAEREEGSRSQAFFHSPPPH